MRNLTTRFGTTVLAAGLLLTLVGVASITSAANVDGDGHEVCITDPEDVTLYSGTCGDDGTWVQAKGDRSGLKYCFDTYLDSTPLTCDDNMGGDVEISVRTA